MGSENWDRLQELFHEARKRNSRHRRAYLEQACPKDPRLRRRVEELLDQACEEDDLDSELDVDLDYETLFDEGLDRYRVLERIGSGGMGVVFCALQLAPVRKVAIKILRPELTSKEMISRFEHEAQILGSINHPAVATIYEADTFVAGGNLYPFFAMELVEGRNIIEYAEEEKLGLREKVALLEEACGGLAHAHEQKVIHCDLKPGNLLVDRSGRPKILDFGVARSVAQGDLEDLPMEEGWVAGTLRYMSPEQLRLGNAWVDSRTDIFSLGVVAYQLFFGTLPYSESLHSGQDLIGAIADLAEIQLPAPRTFAERELGTILEAMLAKNREDRYGSVSELQEDLKRFLRGFPIRAFSTSFHWRFRKAWRRNRRWVGPMVGLGVFFSVVAAYLGSRLEDKSNQVLEMQQDRVLFEEERSFLVRLSVDEKLGSLYSQSKRLFPVLIKERTNRHIVDFVDSLRDSIQQAHSVGRAPAEQARVKLARATLAIAEERAEQALRLSDFVESMPDGETGPSDGELGRDVRAFGCWIRGLARHMLGENAQAYDDLERSVLLGERSHALRYLLGVVSVRIEKLEKASEHFSAVVEGRSRMTYLGHGGLGVVQARKGDLTGSFDHFSRAVALRPDYLVGKWNLATLSMDLGRIDEAVRYIDIAIAGGPLIPHFHRTKALICLRKEAYEEALLSIDRSVEIEPEFGEAHATRGLILAKLKRSDEAMRSCKTALNLGCSDGHYEMAAVWAEKGRWKEALDSIEQFVSIHPKTARGHHMKAAILAGLGRYADAESSFETALWWLPDSPESYKGLFEVLIEQGKLEEVLEATERAFRVSSEIAEPHYYRGVALEELHRNEEAEEEFRRAFAFKGKSYLRYNYAVRIVYRALEGEGEVRIAGLERALEEFERVIAVDEEQKVVAYSYYNIACVLEKLGRRASRLPEALEPLRVAIELDRSGKLRKDAWHDPDFDSLRRGFPVEFEEALGTASSNPPTE